MTKRERTPDIDAEEVIEMFRPEMRRLKTTDVCLENVLDIVYKLGTMGIVKSNFNCRRATLSDFVSVS